MTCFAFLLFLVAYPARPFFTARTRWLQGLQFVVLAVLVSLSQTASAQIDPLAGVLPCFYAESGGGSCVEPSPIPYHHQNQGRACAIFL